MTEQDIYDAIIAAKDARIAELDTELALLRRAACDNPAQPAAPAPGYSVVADPIPPVVADKAKPPKIHDPFNLPRKDPRRMGP